MKFTLQFLSLMALTILTPFSLSVSAGAQPISAPLNGGASRMANAAPPAIPANALPAPTPAGDAGAPEDYRLDTGDVISIEVQRHGDVTRTYRLTSDARVRLPRLSSPLLARGKTCAELATELTERLVKEGKLKLHPNQVTVQVMEMRVRRVFVRGTAGRSGDYDLKNGWRISELLAIIGGVPNPERVTTRLINPQRPETRKIDLYAALNAPESSENVALQEGDTLIMDVPRNKRLLVKGEGPRGLHELDERFGLRQALLALGFSTNGSTGDLRHARLYRPDIPGDPNAPTSIISVDLLALLSDDKTPEIPLQDLDTLEILPSERYIYIYGDSGTRKLYIAEDRKTYLSDIMALGYAPSTKLNDIKVMRKTDDKPTVTSYKFGDFMKNGEPKNNPEIQPKDMIVMGYVTRGDERINTIWQVWGLYGIASSLFPTLRIR